MTPSFRLADLQRLSMTELLAAATDAGLSEAPDFDRRGLIFELQRQTVTATAVGYGTGILEVRPEGYGFLRSPHHGCTPGADDIYVSANQVRRLRLRTGQLIAGLIRLPRDGESYFALLRVETLDGQPLATRSTVVPFRYLPPVLPHTAMPLEHPGGSTTGRLIDLWAPLAFGQRVLLATPPGARQAELLGDLATSVATNHPATEILVLSVDQRPEEQSLLRERLPEHPPVSLFASAFDESPARHVELIELVRARAQRLVEAGRDVVLFVDSLTRVVRAYNATVPHSGKIISAGLDTAALQPAKQLFCLARQTEAGRSLTVLATLLTETGSHLNDAIAEEFAGRANTTITLARQLIDAELSPPIRRSRTATQWEDHILSAAAQRHLRAWRRALPADDQAALRETLAAIATTPTNAALTDAAPRSGSNGP